MRWGFRLDKGYEVSLVEEFIGCFLNGVGLVLMRLVSSMVCGYGGYRYKIFYRVMGIVVFGWYE